MDNSEAIMDYVNQIESKNQSKLKNRNMRKVLFKKWIPRVEISEGVFKRTQEGTNCWESDFTHEGLFHQWGSAYEESSEGFGNYTVALVEVVDGTIEEVLPNNIKFID